MSRRNQITSEYYLSLIVDISYVAGACWQITSRTKPDLSHAVARRIRTDGWDERIQAADQVITALEERLGSEDIHKVILGLPTEYLTENGDIDPKVRSHLKRMTTELDLTPIGYVSVPQAIMYKLKQDEGVPPTAILVGVSSRTVTVSLYKVGTLSGVRSIPLDANVLAHIESVFRDFKQAEVLPSRMLLYGGDREQLDLFKSQLTTYPWPTRANFLHFPKISVLPPDFGITSVSIAGAGELTSSMPDVPAEPDTGHPADDAGASGVVSDAVTGRPAGKTVVDEVVSGEPDDKEDEAGAVGVSAAGKPTAGTEEEDTDTESNVSFVPPEELGFTGGDKPKPDSGGVPKTVQSETPAGGDKDKPTRRPARLSFTAGILGKSPLLPRLRSLGTSVGKNISGNKKMLAVSAAGVAMILLAGWFFVWVSPKAVVRIRINPEQLQENMLVSIDPASAAFDAASMTVPGKTVEQTVSGGKTIPVSGKKKIGDPAVGKVTVYNKSIQSRTVKKGSILTSGSVQFSIDSDVQIASASESVGSITFGKAGAAVTARSIGTQGNLPAGSEFTFADYASSQMIARNDNAFTGGTSRDVTVVSREDYNTLVSQLSKELQDQATKDLASSISGSLRLIDQTVKATVSDKSFSQEIDQEAKELSGTIALSVTGIAYDENDVSGLAGSVLGAKVRAGYELESQKQVSVDQVTVKKDGVITADLKVAGQANPQVLEQIRVPDLTGKPVSAVESTIRQIPGVADVGITVSSVFGKDRMPRRTSAISIEIISQ
ncbi:hypothetical protein A2Z33_06810 [Candidatus Gottesmanbacteria bacterium RBG_16_52_11]|uniref:Baseplate protein J-like barrel domain-containing protein n=1 Tax=Candidatus Gottesmanbacteria bacterium RBG_16_52_11 TaxID=1798374 RepID=A0A1F5YY01_9BACT|nr:MAG: hypothetical protein A2Z33_06810 [Candidatus Gottesmanbacteria bacterium RBG_16_52_11]